MRMLLTFLLVLSGVYASAQTQPVFHIEYKLNKFEYKKKTYTIPDTALSLDITSLSEIVPLGANSEVAVQFEFLESHVNNTSEYLLRIVHYTRRGDHWAPISFEYTFLLGVGRDNYIPGVTTISSPLVYRNKKANLTINFSLEILMK